jgi:hypothetical protein
MVRAGRVPARGNHSGCPYCELCVSVVKSFLNSGCGSAAPGLSWRIIRKSLTRRIYFAFISL